MAGRAAAFMTFVLLGSLAAPEDGFGHPEKPCEPSSTVRCEGQWEVQRSGVADDLRAVFFVDRDTGWAAGAGNTILKTTDGGKTWRRLPLERQERGPRFDEVVFVGPSAGWARSRAVLLFTDDGGESWQPASKPTGLNDFGPGVIVGQNRLQMNVATSGSGIYRTDDGGKTWKPMEGKLPWNSAQTIFFLNPTSGWIAADHGRLARTTDGGATWTEHPLQDQGDLLEPKLRFVTAERGWLMAQRGHKGGILATTDGGKTWHGQYASVPPHRPLQDILFLDERTGWLLAEDRTGQHKVLQTDTGGKNWRTLGNLKATCHALSFPDVSHGWVVGAKGFIGHYHVMPVRVTPGR